MTNFELGRGKEINFRALAEKNLSKFSKPVEDLSTETGNTSKEETRRLLELLYEIDADASIDADAAEIALHLTNEFIEKVSHQAIKIAKHRNSSVVEYKDLRFVLENIWGMRLPGMFKNHLVNLSYSEDIATVNSSNVGSFERKLQESGLGFSSARGVRRIADEKIESETERKQQFEGEYIKLMPSSD